MTGGNLYGQMDELEEITESGDDEEPPGRKAKGEDSDDDSDEGKYAVR